MFDLKAALPQLLPAAIAWAEAMSQEISLHGRELQPIEQEWATTVGVKQPELVRVLVVHELPLPLNEAVREAALASGLLGPNLTGMTLGHGIYVVQGHLESRLLSHELRHVHQYETFGSIASFLPAYLTQVADSGYENAALERDAIAHEIAPTW